VQSVVLWGVAHVDAKSHASSVERRASSVDVACAMRITHRPPADGRREPAPIRVTRAR